MSEALPTALRDAVAALLAANWKERDAAKAAIVELAQSTGAVEPLRAHLEQVRGGVTDLELRWEIEALEEELAPPAEPEPEPEEEEPADDGRPDFVLVYDDPRGLQLYRTREGNQWAMSRTDPMTGQPQTFAVPPDQVEQIKMQLRGSPYWLLGAGEASF